MICLINKNKPGNIPGLENLTRQIITLMLLLKHKFSRKSKNPFDQSVGKLINQTGTNQEKHLN